MKVSSLRISNALLLTNQVFKDERGIFEPSWVASDFLKRKISFNPINANHSYNTHMGIIRGMHYQLQPYGQSKLVSCVSGSIYDVMVDLRHDSETYLKWEAIELSESSGISVLIPSGCAHGFISLKPNTTVSYLIDGIYKPDFMRILRWNDPLIGILWPLANPILSEQDRNAPDYKL